MTTGTAIRARRSDNREQLVRDRAARLFRQRGYHAASARDIAGAVGMLPGSLYYHFASKEDLLVAVYEEGVRMISEAVTRAAGAERDPWRRLEAACVAHLDTLLGGSDYAQVVIRVRPGDVPGAAQRLIRLRDAYEDIFRGLVAALPLPPGADRRALRLLLLGALNWSQSWYRPDGSSPRVIARRFLGLLRSSLAPRGRP
ncbi:MAG: TetR/AcrR family transcriptional regulator [Candidatus Rokubacteria bacterium]|nr:TetR/AcrR family transcriptional regulator [Candidatus Rokubacteria bacterium]MBI3104998.1 TetR/AcrR family transcriptional regulator [Candidatus Rokubacteria bacterium]